MKGEKAEKKSDPGKIFEFEMEKRLQCTECNRVKYSTITDTLLHLQAPVDSKVEKGTEVDFDACLERYFADHAIDDV